MGSAPVRKIPATADKVVAMAALADAAPMQTSPLLPPKAPIKGKPAACACPTSFRDYEEKCLRSPLAAPNLSQFPSIKKRPRFPELAHRIRHDRPGVQLLGCCGNGP
jgi:hypothetical protein